MIIEFFVIKRITRGESSNVSVKYADFYYFLSAGSEPGSEWYRVEVRRMHYIDSFFVKTIMPTLWRR